MTDIFIDKETWEPVISGLLEDENVRHNVREAWSFDWQTHGESAILNEETLLRHEKPVGHDVWSAGLAEFVKSVYVRGHRLVFIAHSGGTIAAMGTTKFLQTLPYAGVILIEPPFFDREFFHTGNPEPRIKAFQNTIMTSRSSWMSSDAAHQWLCETRPWKNWDPRVLRLYVDYGLQLRKNADGSDSVTTRCTKRHEAEPYTDYPAFFDAVEAFALVCKSIPTHVLYGEIDDFLTRAVKESLIDPNKCRYATSVTKIPKVGHMIVQEEPDVLAKTLANLLRSIYESSAISSRL
ncbi:hypothetical protein VKT23_004302 [Stygiomarasmius scandens]|uniref:AB hydrolase-1 domain-containing protein n=1 Tax=Marasmiellus scandens TaxID=2682957 RepID=A0ABR1JUA9_9AGAR